LPNVFRRPIDNRAFSRISIRLEAELCGEEDLFTFPCTPEPVYDKNISEKDSIVEPYTPFPDEILAITIHVRGIPEFTSFLVCSVQNLDGSLSATDLLYKMITCLQPLFIRLRGSIEYGHTHSTVAYSGDIVVANLAGRERHAARFDGVGNVYYERVVELSKDDAS
jgi:hypothetical protein